MLVYLDLNCFNRPFDDQNQTRVAEETQAVFVVLRRLEEGKDQLVWSSVLIFENSQHPLADRRDEIARWAGHAAWIVRTTDDVARRAEELVGHGFRALDALHVACAETVVPIGFLRATMVCCEPRAG